MPGVRFPVMINGIPVVTAPAEIDIITAGQLRTVLLHSAAHGHAAIVVDMTGTRFCDSTGFSVLVRAHRRAVADGGGVRLVIPRGQRRGADLHLDRPGPGHPPVRQPGPGPGLRARACGPAAAPAAARPLR